MMDEILHGACRVNAYVGEPDNFSEVAMQSLQALSGAHAMITAKSGRAQSRALREYAVIEAEALS